MPYVPGEYFDNDLPVDRTVSVDMSQQADASSRSIGRSFNPAQTLGYYAMGALTDLADTIGSSIPYASNAAGIERGDFNNYVLRTIDLPGMNEFYQQNAGGIEIASGVAGIIATDLATRGLTKEAGPLMSFMRKTPYLRRIAVLDEQYAIAKSKVLASDLELAKNAAMGNQAYTGAATIATKEFNPITGLMEPATQTITRNRAYWEAKGLGALVGARQAAIQEGLMALTMNENSMIYDDSAAYNIAMGALGIGLGAAVDAIHTGYIVRKGANSDKIKRAFAGAFDPLGQEEARLTWGRSGARVSGLAPEDFFGGSSTDLVSHLRVQAETLRSEPIGDVQDQAALLSQRESHALQLDQRANEEIQKVTTKGLPGFGDTRFSKGTPGAMEQLDLLLTRDAAGVQNVEMLATLPPTRTISELQDGFEKAVAGQKIKIQSEMDEILESARTSGKPLTEKQSRRMADMQVRLKRLEYQESWNMMVAVDGEWMPPSEGAVLEGFVEPTIIGKNYEDGFLLETKADPGKALAIDQDLTLSLPSGKSMETADHYDVMRAYRLGRAAMDKFSTGKHVIQIPENAPWFQLDLAEEILKRNPEVDVVWPSGMTRESAQVESFVQKAKAINREAAKPLTKAQVKQGLTNEARMSQLRVRYNLPRLTAYERGLLGTSDHPVDFLLRSMGSYSEADLRKMTLDEIKDGVAKVKRLGDMSPVTKDDVKSLRGNSFTYNLTPDGKPMQPLVAYKRPFKPFEWTTDHVEYRLAERKLKTMAELTGQDAGELTRLLAESIYGSEDMHTASRVDQLMDTQIQGSIFGAAPQTFWGSVTKELKTHEHIFRDSPLLLAAQRLNDQVSRLMRDQMKTVVEGAFGDSLKLLSNPRNASTKLLLNQFHSYRPGWDIEAQMVDQGNGFWGFKLGDTDANRTRFRERFGSEMPKGAMLQGPDGKTVVLDGLGKQIQESFNVVTAQILKEKNTLLKSQGLGQISVANHFVPSPEVEGKIMGWVFGPDNRVVPDMAVVAGTQQEFDRLRQHVLDRMAKMPNGGAGYTFRTQDQVKQFATLYDRAQMDLVNPGTTAIQPGKRGAGRTLGPEIRFDAFENSMKYIQNQYMRHGSDVLQAVMKESINAAKARSNIASGLSRNAVTSREDKYRSVYDYYLEALTGRSRQNHPSSLTGAIYKRIEKAVDSGLEQATPPASRAWTKMTDWLATHRIYDRSREGKKEFEAVRDALQNYMPFDDAVKMIEAKSAGATPASLAKITGGINKLSAALMLRMFEVTHPIMNLSGIVNAAPAVIRSFTPQKGETVEAFAARVGHSANIFNVNGNPVATPDMVKLSARAFKRAWSRTAEADYDFMVRRGYLTQEVAEFQRQFAALEQPNKYESAIKSLVDKVSVLSDRSEDFSRSWGHFIGLELADSLGIVGRETRHSFAHDIANKMIANYSPQNRPEVFQGAMGAPLGLFQSFMLNYYQNLFRYLETKNMRALATQYATQSTLFGVTGVPGWSQFNDFVFGASEGERQPTTGIHGAFTGDFGDILAHGILSSIPKLWGSEGIDLYSRGDVQARIPGVGGQSLPGYSVAQKIYGGISEGLSAFAKNHSTMTPTQLAEIASNMVINRPLSGVIEQFLAGGNDVDSYGQLVADTQSWAERIYRVMGVRSERQAKEIEAFYSDKKAMELKASKDESLREATRSAIRAGRDDMLPSIFEKYVENGGDPRYFRRWIKSSIESAMETRSSRQLEKLLNNPAYLDRAMRMIDMGVGIADDEAMGEVESKYGPPPNELDQSSNAIGDYAGQLVTGESDGTDY